MVATPDPSVKMRTLKNNFHLAYRFILLVMLLVLAGCQTTNNATRTDNSGQSQPLMVGPSGYTLQEKNNLTYTYNSDIYLDVVIPIFDPGLPLDAHGEIDYERVEEENIWPQLRRAEAKRFAIQTKQALEKIRAFGSVSVVPTANTTGDLFLLGSVDYSDSEIVKITATVVDSTGKIWGKRQFEHRVSTGFFRDSLNDNKNPYGPVFRQMGDYVYTLLLQRSEARKKTIKDTAMLRYAQAYSPEVFNQYVGTTLVGGMFGLQERYEFTLLSLPSENDAMLNRIESLRHQEQMFIDRLQDQYTAFDMNTVEAYRAWQKETLPEAKAARKARSDKTTKQIIGGLLTAAAIIGATQADSSLQGVLVAGAAVGAVYSFKRASELDAELSVHKATLNEMGENLDIALGAQSLELDNKTIELTGTAGEQYEQWKAHLYKIYQLEKTPYKAL
ncbi:hypothetical protein MNBD_GAMMA26-1721 [hydrothermal vent metagenome]|uniref:Uncharacterized protein n=1 Tax=hydrothermal vent metagenome TaxID=652676 RepID=A0A3B1AQ21_9ZZZZ